MSSARTLQTDPEQRTRNAVWVDAILAAAVHAGVRQAVVSPGGRSAALVVGFARAGIEVVHVATDERSGAFVALGLARITGRPVAVCVTSGSAVANLIPALTEAKPSALPLLVLAADRPGGAFAKGLPQTTDQIGLCAPTLCGVLALDDPDMDKLPALRRELAALFGQFADPARCGPVLVNIPLHGVFTSADAEPGFEPPPAEAVAPAPATPLAARPEGWVAWARALPAGTGRRGLIVVGPDCGLSWDAVNTLALRTGFPVFADVSSGLRRPAVANLVAEADGLVMLPTIRERQADLIIRIGPAPLSLMLQRYLDRPGTPTLRIVRSAGEVDFMAPDAPVVVAPTADDLGQLAEWVGQADADWTAGWRNASARAQAGVARGIAALPWGECVAAHAICNASGYALFHVANSMSARHANLFVGSGPAQTITMNRGVNGIDGTISTFVGEVAGAGAPGLLLIGDQAAVHDMSGLEASRIAGVRGTICIVNNQGGSLLDLFGLDQLPGHGRLIRNPTTASFAAMAAVFGLPYQRCDSAAALRSALEAPLPPTGLQVIEAAVPAGSLLRDLQVLYRGMAVPA
jgi:2-succinyl-5-enolpyruvyl-6-hydroxy-3-cyclohexene-1-carboxylate synthase